MPTTRSAKSSLLKHTKSSQNRLKPPPNTPTHDASEPSLFAMCQTGVETGPSASALTVTAGNPSPAPACISMESQKHDIESQLDLAVPSEVSMAARLARPPMAQKSLVAPSGAGASADGHTLVDTDPSTAVVNASSTVITENASSTNADGATPTAGSSMPYYEVPTSADGTISASTAAVANPPLVVEGNIIKSSAVANAEDASDGAATVEALVTTKPSSNTSSTTNVAAKASLAGNIGSDIDTTIEVPANSKPSFIVEGASNTGLKGPTKLASVATTDSFTAAANEKATAPTSDPTVREAVSGGKPGFHPMPKASLALHLQAPRLVPTIDPTQDTKALNTSDTWYTVGAPLKAIDIGPESPAVA